MRLHEITKTHARPKSRRVGRGNAAGGGTTAGRGTKGQKARTGANSNIPRAFVGGSTSLIQRMPKLKGFKSHAQKPATVNLARLTPLFEEGEKVTLMALLEKGIVTANEAKSGVKIVGSSGTLTKKLQFDTANPLLTTSKKLLA